MLPLERSVRQSSTVSRRIPEWSSTREPAGDNPVHRHRWVLGIRPGCSARSAPRVIKARARRIRQGRESPSQRAVPEEYNTVSESAFIDELEVGARVGR